MPASNKKNSFQPMLNVGMNAHAKQLVGRIKAEKLHILETADEKGTSYANDVLKHVYNYTTNPEMRFCTIMQIAQTLVKAAARNLIVNSRGEGYWLLTESGSKWVPNSEADQLFKLVVDSRLPASFFAKPRAKKNATSK